MTLPGPTLRPVRNPQGRWVGERGGDRDSTTMNDPDEWEAFGPPVCQRCDGEGEIMVCIDDICRGIGECIHGDGYATCPNCKGSGEYEPPVKKV